VRLRGTDTDQGGRKEERATQKNQLLETTIKIREEAPLLDDLSQINLAEHGLEGGFSSMISLSDIKEEKIVHTRAADATQKLLREKLEAADLLINSVLVWGEEGDLAKVVECRGRSGPHLPGLFG